MPSLILPKPTVETVEVSYDAMRRIAAAADVLSDWGLQIVCPKCSALYGVGNDAVVGDNEQGAQTLVVRCGCTIRRCTVRQH